MQLNLTKSQLKTLLELTYLGNWMINAQRDGSKKDPIMQKHDDMAKFIYSKAGEAGLDKEVQYNKEMKKWFPTYDFEMDSEVTEFHNKYDENTFWRELSDRLGGRDLIWNNGEAIVEKMSFEDRMMKRQEFIEKYEDEFYENGLIRLVINKEIGKEKTGRNEPCPCGSGKKYKKCCDK